MTLWELAAVAVVATVHPWRILSMVVAAVAVVLVAATSVRWTGLCLYQWIGVVVRFRRDRRRNRDGADPLAAVLPDMRLRRQIDRAGNRVGLADHGDSLTAVVRLTQAPGSDLSGLLDVLTAEFRRPDFRLAGAQLVTWSVPSPPRARYQGDRRDLEQIQIYWLALRYRPSDAPIATLARGGADTGAARTTAVAALGMVSRLAEAGFAAVVLDEPELRQELLVALGTDHTAQSGAAAGGTATVKHTWQDWSVGTLRQVSYVPKYAEGGRLVLGRWMPQAAFTCTSYSLRRTARGEVLGESRVRVGVHPTAKLPTARQLTRSLGVDLLVRNGRHARSVLDTLPLALPPGR